MALVDHGDTMEESFQSQPHARYAHMAVRMDDDIIIFGGLRDHDAAG